MARSSRWGAHCRTTTPATCAVSMWPSPGDRSSGRRWWSSGSPGCAHCGATRGVRFFVPAFVLARCCSRSCPVPSRTTRCSSCPCPSPRAWSPWSATSAGSGPGCSSSTAAVSLVMALPVIPVGRSVRPRSRGQPDGPGLRRLAGVRPPGHRRCTTPSPTARTPRCSPRTTARPARSRTSGPTYPVYSAQNALYDQARPPERHHAVVVVGGQYPRYAACSAAARSAPARQRGRRRQRGAGPADRRVHRPARSVVAALATAAAPRLRPSTP